MPKDPRNIKISDFHYELPPEAIAQYPLEGRDQSRLLVVRDGKIRIGLFRDLPSFLPENSLVVMNETKVVRARILFRKTTGAAIEIFLLDPAQPVTELTSALGQTSPVTWHGLVGNAKRWNRGTLEITNQSGTVPVVLKAEKTMASQGEYQLRLSWIPADLPLAEILGLFGKVPLPPYIHRAPVPADADRYQTVIARSEGSVAAPTAGLHFTGDVLDALGRKGIELAKLTLHVGAGTFKPVTASHIGDHRMHSEQVEVPRQTIVKLLQHHRGMITLVGTTTVRTLESLYWQGVKWFKETSPRPVISIDQWDPYGELGNSALPLDKSLERVLSVMEENHLETLHGSTSLIIAPGYRYRVPSAIITNFHLPQSTLLLLIAAFLGDDWKRAYDYALENGFRFLSYGDSCLFMLK